MKFIHNDGGRQAAGYKGHTGDCVARSVAIASGRPYSEVYDALANGNATQRQGKKRRAFTGKRTASHGIQVTRKWFKDYMRSIGFEWVATMSIGSGCKVHLNDRELPMGRLVVSVSGHYTAVIEGDIHDTCDPRERGVTIYPIGYPGPLPKGARLLDNGNGYAYEPERCVYGYWRLVT